MRSATLALCCLVVSLFPFSGQSVCAGESPAVSIAVGGGVTYPLGDIGITYNAGPHVTGIAAIDLGAIPLRLRIKGTYFKMETPNGILGPARYSGSFKGTGGLAEVAWMIPTHTRFQPYVFGGAGGFDMTLKYGDSVAETDFENDMSEGALSFGGGADVTFGTFGLFGEWTYYHIMTTPAINFHQFTLGARLGVPL